MSGVLYTDRILFLYCPEACASGISSSSKAGVASETEAPLLETMSSDKGTGAGIDADSRLLKEVKGGMRGNVAFHGDSGEQGH